MENTLYYGDNLKILKEYLPDESVDLIYLDPPFNSSATYNVLFKDESGDSPSSQIKAFSDTWHWADAADDYYRLLQSAPTNVLRLIEGYYEFIGPCPMMAYLSMMTTRLLELRRVLKQEGSIYLHCDHTASHYLKNILDSIFGIKNFRNEIIWRRSLGHHLSTKRLDIVTDSIFFYTKSENSQFNIPSMDLTESELEKKFPYVEEGTGRKYQHRNLEKAWNEYNKEEIRTINGKTLKTGLGWIWTQETIDERLKQNPHLIFFTSGGKPRYKIYADEYQGKRINNLWTDIYPLSSMDAERLGYPTQKPVELLERIIKMSSKEGDIVMDPFCGCGTTIEAAEKFHRKWIGVDITHLAIQLVRKRLNDAFEGRCEYVVKGIPEDYDSARLLAEQDKYEFQWWALSLVDARPFGGEDAKKKGIDRGIDGIFSFRDEAKKKSKMVIISVKGGKSGPAHIRDLKGVIEREKAVMGVLITLNPPTKEMKNEAASAGYYESELFKRRFPKIQILSVKEFFEENQRAEMPRFTGRSIDFKQALKVQKESKEEQNHLKI